MKKYQIIYADPPWRYEFSPKAGSSIERHYPTMTVDELCALPVNNLVASDCFLFLWTTGPKLDESLAVLKAWGFTYRTIAFCWVKNSKELPNKPRYLGAGSYTRPNVELVLLGRNSKQILNLNSKKVESVVISPRQRHSQKPSIVRNRIVEMVGDVPRIELFARKPDTLLEDPSWEGWDVWGNEVKSDIILDKTEEGK